MVNEDIRGLTGVIKEIATEAGKMALAGFRSESVQYSLKANIHDIVTEYDKACEDYIITELLKRFPGSSVVGEETGCISGNGDITWYIDPIDGTANFARGIAVWAVSIAAVVEGEVVAAVINDAANGQVFWADSTGSYVNERKIASRGFRQQEAATLVAHFGLPRDFSYKPELALRQYRRLQTEFGHIKQMDCATVPLCWVAAGWLDGSFGFETNSWDLAAASLVVKQAGGEYWTYIDGEPKSGFLDLPDIHFFASIPGAEYPLVEEIMETQSRRPARQPSEYNPRTDDEAQQG